MRIFTIFLMLSLQINAEIRTCEDLEKSIRNELSNDPKHWHGNAIFRKQAEKLAAYYIGVYGVRNWDNLPTLADIKTMSDQELDAFGAGIYFAELTDRTGQSYIYAQFGFGGGNWFSLIFHRGSAQLATHIYEWDGECQVLSN
jgi:hypothetical protein